MAVQGGCSKRNKSSKRQSRACGTPEKRQASNSKANRGLLVWMLIIEVSLELGAWNLLFLKMVL